MKNILEISIILFLMIGFNQLHAKDLVKPANQVGVYPITVTKDGYGLGLFYERKIGSNDKVSIVMPVRLLIKAYGSYDPSIKNTTPYRNYMEFAPAMKLYITNREKATTFSVGPSLYYSYLSSEGLRVLGSYPGTISRELFEYKIHSFGALGNIFLDIAVSNHFVMGLQTGFGVNYLNHVRNIFSEGV